jgi:hypothetical protein
MFSMFWILLGGIVMLLNPLKFVKSSDGMRRSGYSVDCVVFGVSGCREFVYVLQCGSLEVNSPRDFHTAIRIPAYPKYNTINIITNDFHPIWRIYKFQRI